MYTKIENKAPDVFVHINANSFIGKDAGNHRKIEPLIKTQPDIFTNMRQTIQWFRARLIEELHNIAWSWRNLLVDIYCQEKMCIT